jgi:hypothetical protein
MSRYALDEVNTDEKK